jgi:hypothetical protein
MCSRIPNGAKNMTFCIEVELIEQPILVLLQVSSLECLDLVEQINLVHDNLMRRVSSQMCLKRFVFAVSCFEIVIEFSQLLRPEVERRVPWWSWIGAISGGGIGFIVANLPGLLLGAAAGNRLGAVRDAKGKSVAAVFNDLGGQQKAEVKIMVYSSQLLLKHNSSIDSSRPCNESFGFCTVAPLWRAFYWTVIPFS